MTTDIMTIREVAAYLKLTEKTTYRLAAQGEIPGFMQISDGPTSTRLTIMRK